MQILLTALAAVLDSALSGGGNYEAMCGAHGVASALKGEDPGTIPNRHTTGTGRDAFYRARTATLSALRTETAGDVERITTIVAQACQRYTETIVYGSMVQDVAERIVRELRPIPTKPLPALSAEQLATILAGLRILQNAQYGAEFGHVHAVATLNDVEDILTPDLDNPNPFGLLLPSAVIDALCERLNTEG